MLLSHLPTVHALLAADQASLHSSSPHRSNPQAISLLIRLASLFAAPVKPPPLLCHTFCHPLPPSATLLDGGPSSILVSASSRLSNIHVATARPIHHLGLLCARCCTDCTSGSASCIAVSALASGLTPVAATHLCLIPDLPAISWAIEPSLSRAEIGLAMSLQSISGLWKL